MNVDLRPSTYRIIDEALRPLIPLVQLAAAAESSALQASMKLLVDCLISHL